MGKVRLFNYNEQYYTKTVEWLNSEDIKKSFGLARNITLEEHANWMKNVRNIYIRAIKADEEYIGNILFHLNVRHSSAFFQIYIGDKKQQGKGYATEAMILALNDIFNNYNIHRVWLKVFLDNLGAIALYKKIGFKCEGTERDSFKEENGYKSQLIFSILKDEWVKNI